MLRYNVLASDADLDRLTFELTDAPDGATIDTFGRITWATSVALIGLHDFAVKVTDPRGGEATQAFALEVIEDLIAPKLSLIENLGDGSRNILPWQGPFTVFVRAIDNVEIASLTLQANGKTIPLDAAGTATFTFEEWAFATITATATAIDTNGNITQKTIEFDYDFPEGWSGAGTEDIPTAIITSPADTDAVTGMVSIVGTASHADFAAYKLSYRHVNETSFTEFLESTTPVTNGELGVWDTTLLLNDEYVIRLEVATNAGVVNVVEHHIGLAGELKLGNFRLSFTDMVIPVAGIPIEITRIYDTLQADREGDFGYGWRLEYRDTDLRVGLPKSGLEDIGIYSPMRPGVKVYLNVPGQGRQGFTFNPEIRVLPGFGGNNLVLARPRFTPDPGVTSTLSTGTSGYLQVNEQGELFAPGGIPYNPASPDFGGAYVLTTRDQVTYRIDGATGKLNSAIDRNGNSLRFTGSGIESSLGPVALISRDRQQRITSISDSLGGMIVYSYLGDQLVAVRDRNGEAVSIGYDSQSPPLLDEIVDQFGTPVLSSKYDENGRLTGVVDADGNASTALFDPSQKSSEITDALGNKRTLVFNDFGKITSATDPMGNVRQYRYDSNGNLRGLTESDGATNQFEYDQAGNLVTLVDALGGRTYQRFEDGQITERTNRLGFSEKFAYDESGNLTSHIDYRGQETSWTYDQHGNLQRIIGPDGNWTELQYSPAGRLIMSSNAVGQQLEIMRDANGRITKSSISHPTSQEIAETTYSYDASGRLLVETDPIGGQNIATFDRSGNPVSVENSLHEVRTTEYSSTGRLNSSTNSDGVATGLTYDAVGRTTSLSYADGSAYHYEYDALGRLIGLMELLPDDSTRRLWTRTYDSVGRILSQTDFGEGTTTYQYDPLGRRVAIIDPYGNKLSFEFDAENRVTKQTTPLGKSTEFTYDASGNLIQKSFADGSQVTMTLDSSGRPIQAIDELGVMTRYGYDPAGNLTRVVEPNGIVTKYEYTQADRLASITDAGGNVTEFRYDAAGNRTLVMYPDGNSEATEYDSESRLVRFINEAGESTVYVRDNLGITNEVRYFDGATQNFTYDDRGRLREQRDANGTTTFQYSPAGELASRTDSLGNRVDYTYTATGQVASVIADGYEIAYDYDLLGRIIAMSDQDGLTTRYEYDADGNFITTQFPNGITERREYDLRNRLVEIVQSKADETLASYRYDLDALGRIVGVTELDGTYTSFAYSERRELVEERTVASNGDIVLWQTYDYDKLGNRVRKSDLVENVTEISTFDVRGRLLSRSDGAEQIDYEYDASGRVVKETASGGRTVETSWNSYGRMQKVSITDGSTSFEITYVFDIDGNLISRSENGSVETIVYDTNKEHDTVLLQYDHDGIVSNHYGFANSIGFIAGPTESHHLLSDGQGNVRMRTDQTGNVVATHSYDAYGVLLEPQVENSLELQFNEELRDTVLAIDFLRARVYVPSTGTFNSQDPFEGLTATPISQNAYAFVGNDPVNVDDPSGEYNLLGVVVAAGLVTTIATVAVFHVVEARAQAVVDAQLTPSATAAYEVAVRLSANILDGGHYEGFVPRRRRVGHFIRAHQEIWAEIAAAANPGTIEFGSFVNASSTYSGLTAAQVGTNENPPLAIEKSANSDKNYGLLVSSSFRSIDPAQAETLENVNASAGKVGLVVTAFAKAIGYDEYPKSGVLEFQEISGATRIKVSELNEFGKHAAKAF